MVPCQAWGHPKPNVRWYQEGEQVRQSGETGEWESGDYFADGEFQCFATNGAGMYFINITLLRTTECEALLLFFFFSSFSFLQSYSLIDSCLPFPFPQDN